jgi:hypothetical protein
LILVAVLKTGIWEKQDEKAIYVAGGIDQDSPGCGSDRRDL